MNAEDYLNEQKLPEIYFDEELTDVNEQQLTEAISTLIVCESIWISASPNCGPSGFPLDASEVARLVIVGRNRFIKEHWGMSAAEFVEYKENAEFMIENYIHVGARCCAITKKKKRCKLWVGIEREGYVRDPIGAWLKLERDGLYCYIHEGNN